MANFNLPFGIRVSNDSVLDASRYVVDDISARDFIITDGRAYNGLQTYVKDNSTLYILKDVSNSIWGIIPDLSTIAISDASKLNNYTDTFYGDLTIDGSIVISGNIIQDGSYYVTNVEEITSKNEFITLRDDAITPLNDGSISGIRISKADGSTNVVLGASNDAVMRVGWEGDNLLAIATREDNPTNYGYAYWDDASAMFKTDLLVESVSRTIYVETTGSDETGDGLSVGTAFATIGKALSTVKKVINAGITVTINIGVGTFNFTENDLNVLPNINGSGYLLFQGQLGLIESGFSVGSALSTDPMTYTVSGGDVSSWTSNEFQYKLLKVGTSYYPVNANTNSNISIAKTALTGGAGEIYEHQTILTLGSATGVVYDLKNVTFNRLRFNIANSTYFRELTETEITMCYFYASASRLMFFGRSAGRNTHGNVRIGYSIFQNISLNLTTFNASLINCYNEANTSGPTISVPGKNRTTGLSDIVSKNTNTGTLAYCFQFLYGDGAFMANGLKGISEATRPIFALSDSAELLDFDSVTAIIVNGGYLFSKFRTTDSDYSRFKFKFPASIIYGTPIVRWFLDPMYEFVNLTSGRNIQITGLIYPEFEQNLSSNLTNNTTIPIIIGDVSQNMSISLDYTVKRSTALRKGKIDFMHDGSSLYQSPDSFMCSSSILDASALYFNSDVSGNLIRFNAIMDSGSDASLFYNVSRVMKTPLTI